MAKVFPLADVLGFKVDADMYRMAIGIIEIVCGAILAVIPGITWLHSSSPEVYKLSSTV